MDYAVSFLGLKKHLSRYYQSSLKNDMQNVRFHMDMIQHYTKELEESTKEMERDYEKRGAVTV